MKTLEPELLATLQPFSRRLMLGHCLLVAYRVSLAIFAWYLLVLIFYRFYPSPFWRQVWFGGGVLLLGISSVWCWIKKPAWQVTAHRLDSMGLEARVITALELSGQSGFWPEQQRQDTVACLAKIDQKKIKLLKRPTNIDLSAVGIIMLMVVLLLMPYPLARDKINGENQIDQVEAAITEAVEELDFSGKTNQDLLRRLEALLKKSQEAEDDEQLKESLAEVKNELQQELNKVNQQSSWQQQIQQMLGEHADRDRALSGNQEKDAILAKLAAQNMLELAGIDLELLETPEGLASVLEALEESREETRKAATALNNALAALERSENALQQNAMESQLATADYDGLTNDGLRPSDKEPTSPGSGMGEGGSGGKDDGSGAGTGQGKHVNLPQVPPPEFKGNPMRLPNQNPTGFTGKQVEAPRMPTALGYTQALPQKVTPVAARTWSTMDRSQLTPGLQQLVRNYFQSLTARMEE